MASDTFTGTNGTNLPTYSANWSAVLNNLYIQTNAVAPNASAANDCYARWNAQVFANDQYSEFTVVAVAPGTGHYIGVGVRMKTDNSQNLYGYYSEGVGGLTFMFKNVATVGSQLGSTGTGFAINDVVRLQISGTTLTPMRNGALDSSVGAVTDSSHVSGSAGVVGSGVGTDSRGDNWVADDLKQYILSKP